MKRLLSYETIIEGLLFVVGDEGMEVRALAETLDISEAAAREQLSKLEASFKSSNRPFQLMESAGVYKLVTVPDVSPYIQKYVGTMAEQALSRAAMETLVIIAYKQPVTRADIEEIRGVKVERVIHTLLSKGLIESAGRAKTIGRAKLYRTTEHFLDHFGFNSLEELPPLTFEDELTDEGDLFFGQESPKQEERLEKD
ncbi:MULTISPECIES: SMC-Scp complex subunit ScpB [Exiguobacterium]|jgi:segregation and condensation protein B|uniref:Segregation and condensation protein B n=1 Tax=Exiguobacterium profundum TaxID=307643 RepID=A0ABY8B3P3_9BACL|nr:MULTISPECIES: SMC-Scp complex subunit ScpB [Exiguobacterium]MCC9625007.1 SMC-Scp complex subunit ScpB [Thalassospira sp. MA62]MCM3281157.1 SMC-Scp complex subunit ScpB [Exiguobacterium sp. MER 193]WED56526.1 SMC-Scp complex subunit ScpB [Exiguobacterium profundum]